MMISWLFGRGASVACNLTWTEPFTWRLLPRQTRETKLIEKIRTEMTRASISTTPYKNLLSILYKKTPNNFKNLLMTTNWDYLLKQEVDRLFENEKFTSTPPWLASPWVFHLNGSADPTISTHRSKILFESDPWDMREESQEFNQAISYLLWESRVIVAIGMSFKCEVDRVLSKILEQHQDNLPVGESKIVILNPNCQDLAEVSVMLQEYMPRSHVVPLNVKFEDWLNNGFDEVLSDLRHDLPRN